MISIHAPHEGERLGKKIDDFVAYLFQSTLPTRGSDADLAHDARRKCISIHAPHEGERRQFRHEETMRRMISIHAPHEGERPFAQSAYKVQILFQSTLPTRGSDTI